MSYLVLRIAHRDTHIVNRDTYFTISIYLMH